MRSVSRKSAAQPLSQRRWRSTVLLSLGLAILVVVLGITIWRWLGQTEAFERVWMQQVIRHNSWLFKAAFDREIDNLALELARAASTDEGSETLDERINERLDHWRTTTRWPDLLSAVYRTQSGSTGPVLERLDQVDPVSQPEQPEQPEQLAASEDPVSERVASALASDPELVQRLAETVEFAPFDYFVETTIPAIVVPTGSPDPILAVLDYEVLTSRLLPDLKDSIIPRPSDSTIELAVVDPVTQEVLYSTLDIDHLSDFGRIDAANGLAVSPGRPDLVLDPKYRYPIFTKTPGKPSSQDIHWSRDFYSGLFFAGNWMLASRFGDQPIPEVVAQVRRRRMMLAVGLLAMLSTSLFVLAIITRRIQRAAHDRMQQLARVSHELRTPLSVLSTAGDNLADRVISRPDQMHAYGRAIQKETRRLHEMVENVLHLARRSSRSPRMTPQRFDLIEIVNEALALTAAQLEEAGFTVERSLPDGPIEIEGQPRGVRSALINLLSNAIKYGRSGRWLRIAVEVREAKAHTSVEDRGPGLEAHEAKKVFAPYVRGSQAEQAEGSGLGLAVVKDVIEAHGGTVKAGRGTPSGPGKPAGARFDLVLPLASEPSSSRRASRRPPNKSSRAS